MTFRKAYCTDPTVRMMVNAGAEDDEIIAKLIEIKMALIEELIKLTAIAPKAIRMPDGKVIVWRCPDHLVPMQGWETK